MDVTVGTDMDRVMLYVRKLVIPIPYATSHKIAAVLTLASNHSANLSHADHVDRSTIIEEDIKAPIISTTRRGTMPGKFLWKVDCDSERVILYLGDHVIKLHYTTAAKLSVEMKLHAKTAKAWAGDTGRHWFGVGNLTVAEDNYRRGIT